MISAYKIKKYFMRKYSDKNTARMIANEIKWKIKYGSCNPSFAGKWYSELSEGTIKILIKNGYIIRIGEDKHCGELAVLFRDVDEYIGQLYVLPDEKSVSSEVEDE